MFTTWFQLIFLKSCNPLFSMHLGYKHFTFKKKFQKAFNKLDYAVQLATFAIFFEKIR